MKAIEKNVLLLQLRI